MDPKCSRVSEYRFTSLSVHFGNNATEDYALSDDFQELFIMFKKHRTTYSTATPQAGLWGVAVTLTWLRLGYKKTTLVQCFTFYCHVFEK